jgi:hypothetical protein
MDAGLKGAEFTDNGFLSTSSDKQIAVGFVRGDAVSILFRIRGTAKSISFDEILGKSEGTQTESEILINRGTRFRITGIDKGEEGRNGNGMNLIVVNVEIIP